VSHPFPLHRDFGQVTGKSCVHHIWCHFSEFRPDGSHLRKEDFVCTHEGYCFPRTPRMGTRVNPSRTSLAAKAHLLVATYGRPVPRQACTSPCHLQRAPQAHRGRRGSPGGCEVKATAASGKVFPWGAPEPRRGWKEGGDGEGQKRSANEKASMREKGQRVLGPPERMPPPPVTCRTSVSSLIECTQGLVEPG
jgi:hypothetical protein